MLYEAVGDNNVTWNSACLKVPLVPSKYSDFVKNKEEVEPVEDDYEGGFQLLDLIITELKSHTICYNPMPLIG